MNHSGASVETQEQDSAVRIHRPRAERPGDAPQPSKELGGRKDASEPTRYGDWEKQGRCIDF